MSKFNKDHMHLYGTASQSAYLRNRSDRQNLMNKNGLGEWKLDMELSNKEHTVYNNKNTGEVIFSVRGTDISNQQGGKAADLATDGVLMLGLEKITPRYKRSKKGLEKTQDKYKGKKIIISGHSLGGKIGSELAKEKKLEAHVFNQGSTVAHGRRGVIERLAGGKKAKEQKKRINHYVVVGDAISNSSFFDPSITNHIVEPNPEVKRPGVMYWHDTSHFNNTRIM